MDFEMPKPGPEHQILAKLSGHWIGEETMMPSAWCPDQQLRQGAIQARVLDDFFVISDYEQRAGDQVTFRGHGVYSFDPQAKEYVMYWFDSMGGAGGIARGHYAGNQLTFRNTSPMGHHQYQYTFESGKTIFTMSMSQDGKEWKKMMEAHYQPA